MNVSHLLTDGEVVLLEAYRRSCAMHRETVLCYAEAAGGHCASGRAPASCCARSVAPEPARPQPVPLTLVSRRRRVRSARARAQPARLSIVTS